MGQVIFHDGGELQAWLESAGIDLTFWGRGDAKRVADLWLEYRNGESSFFDEPPFRLIEVVQINIRRGDLILLELEQEFSDGRRRVRSRPPAEKLKQGESPREAAIRCLQEELRLEESEVRLEGEEAAAEEIIISTSYPGLPTHYKLYTFEATTDTLPDEDFYRDNIPSDPIRHHLWGWRRIGSNGS